MHGKAFRFRAAAFHFLTKIFIRYRKYRKEDVYRYHASDQKKFPESVHLFFNLFLHLTLLLQHLPHPDNPALTSLNGNATTGEITFASNTGDGSLTADVVNQSGATLPETGGIGTTIFYIVGGILVVTAGILLITKKRMSINEEK